MRRLMLVLFVFLTVHSLLPAQETKAKLLIAFASYRDRPKHPNIFFYEHDGVSSGKVIGSITTPRSVATAEAHPWLTADGKYCAFTFEEENKTGRIHFWDIGEKKLIDLPKINETPNAQLSPTMTADGNLICFSALNRPMGAGPGYHIYLYDRPAKKLLDLPGLNHGAVEDRMAKMSADGRFIVFVSNRKEGEGLSDIFLYDRME